MTADSEDRKLMAAARIEELASVVAEFLRYILDGPKPDECEKYALIPREDLREFMECVKRLKGEQ